MGFDSEQFQAHFPHLHSHEWARGLFMPYRRELDPTTKLGPICSRRRRRDRKSPIFANFAEKFLVRKV